MATFLLIPGAGGAAWYWHLVAGRLVEAGHEAIPVDLPGDDESAGLPEYTQLVLDAIGDRGGAVLVAQSLGAFTAPLVAARTPLARARLRQRDDPGAGRDGRASGGTTPGLSPPGGRRPRATDTHPSSTS